MGRYLLRRLAFALLLIFVVSSAALLLTRVAPGDFTTQQSLNMDPDTLARLRRELGLDRPLAAQYFSWLGGAVRFDFGQSYYRDIAVIDLIKEKMPVSISIGLWMTLLSYGISIPHAIIVTRLAGLGGSEVR